MFRAEYIRPVPKKETETGFDATEHFGEADAPYKGERPWNILL
jgi:hypothetical protein